MFTKKNSKPYTPDSLIRSSVYNYLCKKKKDMTTMTITINEHSNYGKALLELIKIGVQEKKGIEVIKKPNAGTLKAIEDVENGRTFKVKSSKELFKELGI